MAARRMTGISLGYKAYVADGSGGWGWPVGIPFFTPSGALSTAIDELSGDRRRFRPKTRTSWNGSQRPNFLAQHRRGLDIPRRIGGVHSHSRTWSMATTASRQVVSRGCLDTAPAAFPPGTRVWFISYGSKIVNIRGPVPPTDDRTRASTSSPTRPRRIYLRLVSGFDGGGHHAGAARRSYCPTDVRFNGQSYPASITGELDLCHGASEPAAGRGVT